MGVYSHNNTSLSNYIDMSEIVADESYVGLAGASRMLLENVQNEQMMFDAVIGNDFTEVSLMSEGADAEIYALQEAAVGGLFDKIKAFLKKIVEKIKGLFHSFMARINGVITRDNKQLLKKYKSEVLKKNCKDMKYKWSNRTSVDMAACAKTVEQINTELNKGVDKVYSLGIDDTTIINDINKLQEKIDDGTILEGLLGKALPTTQKTCEAGEFDKEYHECLFEDEELEDDGLDSGRKSYIMTVLDNSSKTMKTAKDFIKNTEKLSAKALKRVDEHNKIYIKAIPSKADVIANVAGKEYKYNFDNLYSSDRAGASKAAGTMHGVLKISTYNKILNTMYSYLTQVQTALTKTSAAYMREVQFEIKQARRVFVQAAAYRPKANKEDMDILFDAIEESVDYEVSSDFEMLTI